MIDPDDMYYNLRGQPYPDQKQPEPGEVWETDYPGYPEKIIIKRVSSGEQYPDIDFLDMNGRLEWACWGSSFMNQYRRTK